MASITDLYADLYKMGEWEPLELEPKQHEALKYLTDSTTTELLFGGAAGGGKSWLACLWTIMQCLAYPGVRYFIGRESLKKLTESTLLSFGKVVNELKIGNVIVESAEVIQVKNAPFKYNAQYHYFQFNNGSRIDFLDLGYYPGDKEYERYGGFEYTGGVIEEAGEVHSKAREVMKTRVGRQLNDKYKIIRKTLYTANPKKNWLYTDFYKPSVAGTLKSTLKFVISRVEDNRRIESGYIDILDEIKDKITYQRLRQGIWEYDQDATALIEYDKILDLFTNRFINDYDAEKYLTADIARFGRDSTVIFLWLGFRVEMIFVLFQQSMTQIAAFIENLQDKFYVPNSNTVCDEDGVGGGVVDILGCKGFQNNSSPKEELTTGEVYNYLKRPNYDNLKSQCGFRMADRINKNEVYVNPEGLSEEQKQFIIAELEQVRQKSVDSDGKKALMSKDLIKAAIGRSPDYQDNFIMREFFELEPSTHISSSTY